MTETIKIRASSSGQETTVRLLLLHPMESGNRKDASGAVLPAHHITDLQVTHNGRPVLVAQFGPAVARDPLISFRFAGGRPGDTIAVSWTDNHGASRSAQGLVV